MFCFILLFHRIHILFHFYLGLVEIVYNILGDNRCLFKVLYKKGDLTWPGVYKDVPSSDPVSQLSSPALTGDNQNKWPVKATDLTRAASLIASQSKCSELTITSYGMGTRFKLCMSVYLCMSAVSFYSPMPRKQVLASKQKLWNTASQIGSLIPKPKTA